MNLTLGGRVDHYAILSQARFSPRAGVNVRLADTLSWNSSAGSYYQQPAFLFVSAFPQNASLVPWRANHYVTGLAWSPDASLRVTAEAYRKIVRRALARARLSPALKGAHLFRHSLATRMLRHGASLPEIGVVLRHRAVQTTEIYAKVDLDSLRALAQPWPETGGAR